MAEGQEPTQEAHEGEQPEARPAGQPSDKNVRMWGMLCHLSAAAGFVIPFGNVLGPLVVWLIKRNEDPFIDEHGKASLNFQITMAIYGIVAALLCLVAIGVILLLGLVVFDVVMTVKACIKANDGESFAYPYSLQLVK